MGRRSVVFLLVLYVWLPSQSVRAQQFEGVIDIQISTPAFDEYGSPESVVQRFFIKHPNIRIEVEGSLSDIVVLVDNAEREIYVLDSGLKRYTKSTFDEYRDEDDHADSPVEFDMNTPAKEKTILNYKTELIEFTARGDEHESFDRIEVWATRQLGSLFGDLFIGMTGGDVEQPAWQAALIERNLFPLQTKTFHGRYLLEETEVTHIERRALGQDLFVIPADYRHVDLSK